MEHPVPLALDTAAALPAAPVDRRHRWKVLAAGVAANASFSAVFSGIPVTSVVLRSDYRLSNSELGLALGLLSLGVAIGELPWGVLTDRLGDRRVLLTGLLGWLQQQFTRALPHVRAGPRRAGGENRGVEFVVAQGHPVPERGEHALRHVGGGRLGEGDAEDFFRRHAIEQQPDDAVDQHMGLAGAGVGGDER